MQLYAFFPHIFVDIRLPPFSKSQSSLHQTSQSYLSLYVNGELLLSSRMVVASLKMIE